MGRQDLVDGDKNGKDDVPYDICRYPRVATFPEPIRQNNGFRATFWLGTRVLGWRQEHMVAGCW